LGGGPLPLFLCKIFFLNKLGVDLNPKMLISGGLVFAGGGMARRCRGVVHKMYADEHTLPVQFQVVAGILRGGGNCPEDGMRVQLQISIARLALGLTMKARAHRIGSKKRASTAATTPKRSSRGQQNPPA
jgi:hypothetical protein